MEAVRLQLDSRRTAKRLTVAIRQLQEHLALTTGRFFDKEVAQLVNLLAEKPDHYNADSVAAVRNRQQPLSGTPEELVRDCVDVFTEEDVRQTVKELLTPLGIEPGTRVGKLTPLWSDHLGTPRPRRRTTRT